MCVSAGFFSFGVQIFFFLLNKWHVFSQIHSYIFIRPLEKVLTFKALPLQVGFYDAETLVSLDPLSRWRIVKSPQRTISDTLSCTFCLLLFTHFKGFSVRNTTLRDILSPESWQRLPRLWGEKNKTKLISIPSAAVPDSFFPVLLSREWKIQRQIPKQMSTLKQSYLTNSTWILRESQFAMSYLNGWVLCFFTYCTLRRHFFFVFLFIWKPIRNYTMFLSRAEKSII